MKLLYITAGNEFLCKGFIIICVALKTKEEWCERKLLEASHFCDVLEKWIVVGQIYCFVNIIVDSRYKLQRNKTSTRIFAITGLHIGAS